MERLTRFGEQPFPRPDLRFDIRAAARPACPRASEEIGAVGLRVSDRGNHGFAPTLMPGFHDHVPSRQVLQNFRKRLPAIERRRDLLRIGTRELKKDMGSDGKDRGAHLRGVLIEELVCRRDRNPEFSAFAEHRLEPTSEGDKILDFVAVKGEEVALCAGEQCGLEARKEQAAEGDGLRPEPPFVEVQNDPAPFIHRALERKRRALLAHDMAEARIPSEGRCLVEDGLPHRGAHRLSCRVVPEFEVLPHFGVRRFFESHCAESGVREKRREFEEREAVLGENIERIPQELVRTRSEGVEVPPFAEHLGKLGDAEKAVVRRLFLERVDADGCLWIGGLDDDEPFAQIFFEPVLLRGNRRCEEVGGVAVKIEVAEAAARFDVLRRKMPQEERFPAAGFPENGDVLGAAALRNPYSIRDGFAVHNLRTDVERPV